MLNRFNRGDTIIEVLLAVTIFSLVSIGSMTVMNQGVNASQRAIEITHVRQQIDAQAEALRAAQQAHTVAADSVNTVWEQITTGTDTPVFADSGVCPTSQTNGINGTFIMDARNATKGLAAVWYTNPSGSSAPPYAQVEYSTGAARSYGMWIERRAISGTPRGYDFTIRACWSGAGINRSMNLATVVRLYDPS